MKQSQRNYKRVVIKVGSSFMCSDGLRSGCLALRGIVDNVALLAGEGSEIVLVSSGAIAFGMHILGFKERPKELHYLQACSAVGQNELMDLYRELFRGKDINSSQVLLTWDDFTDKKRYANTRNTLLALLKLGCVPIINENDTVSTDEIRFGDNDRLSALVSSLISADLLIILSDVQGLLDREKNLVRVVPEITAQIKDLAAPTSRKTSVGGMITKIEAAKIAVDSGIPCVIADGKNAQLISRIVNENDLIGDWTLFLPKKSYLASNKRWIAFSAKPKGRIIVDEGAKKALINRKSLLSVGVVGVGGNFASQDVISITDREGREFARGKACVSSSCLDKVKGKRFEKEIVHCDNIVIF